MSKPKGDGFCIKCHAQLPDARAKHCTACWQARRAQLPDGVLVDDDVRPMLSEFRWYKWRPNASACLYCKGYRPRDKFRISLHRFIANAGPGDSVDHVNGDGLDNRRANLRKLTHAQNHQNRQGLQANNTSGYRGVTWDKIHNRWAAHCKVDGKMRTVGYSDNAHEAGRIAAEWRRERMPFSEMDKVAV